MLSFLSSVLICSVIALVLGAESEVQITKYSVRDVSSLTSRIVISSGKFNLVTFKNNGLKKVLTDFTRICELNLKQKSLAFETID